MENNTVSKWKIAAATAENGMMMNIFVCVIATGHRILKYAYRDIRAQTQTQNDSTQ